jgi:DNA-binding NtrC family response regulator
VEHILGSGAPPKPEPLVPDRYGSRPFAMAKELFERDYLAQKLRECDYNVAKAAEAAGIHPSGLHAKIKKLEIGPER